MIAGPWTCLVQPACRRPLSDAGDLLPSRPVCSSVHPIHSISRQVTQPVSLDGIPRRRADDRLRWSRRTAASPYAVGRSQLNLSRARRVAPRFGRHRANSPQSFFICLSRAGTILMHGTSSGPIARSSDVFCLGPDAVA